MNEASEEVGTARHPTRRLFLRIMLVISLVLVLAALGVWLERRQIAGRIVDRTLRDAGVAARYTIADLGPGQQRLTNVVIGNPDRPDLVADWIETETRIGWSGAHVTGVRARHVRLRATLKDGKVSFGAIDRLLPPPGGKPFALPALDVSVADGRIALATPYGPVTVKLAGTGRLNDGFNGTLKASSDRLALNGCRIRKLNAAVDITVDRRSPTIRGPVSAESAGCWRTLLTGPRTDIVATFSPAFDRWRGNARVNAANLSTPYAAARSVAGRVQFAGTAGRTGGTLDLAAARVERADWRAEHIIMKGNYRFGADTGFAGRIAADGVSTDIDRLVATGATVRALAGSPVAPLAVKLQRALRDAGRRFSVRTDAAIELLGQGGAVRLTDLAIAARSGGRLSLSGGDGVTYVWPQPSIRINTHLATSGGGIPETRFTLSQEQSGAPLNGQGSIAPYSSGGAQLALGDLNFSAAPGGLTRITTRMTLSGPFGAGRIDNARIPIRLSWDGGRNLTVNPACAPVAADRLTVAGFVTDRLELRFCPVDGAMVRVGGGGTAGGVRLGANRIDGRLGSTPIAIALDSARFVFDRRTFDVAGLRTRIGMPARATRLEFADLSGRLTKDGLNGLFAGGGGRIGNVPLLLSGAIGHWNLSGGKLSVGGSMSVRDAAETARFKPMLVRDVLLALSGNAIAAQGELIEPTHSRDVAALTIRHDLANGRGRASIDVPGIQFDEGFQPELLTPVTFGVIADVRGRVSGSGRIDWSPDAVSSTGVFTTPATDLAAAFGPVTGLATTIRFTDLLALESAPGQIATVASINPGIAVTDGQIVYQTYRDARVLVNSGYWPFAGGALTLDPTLLDFSALAAKRLTFRVKGAAADKFLQQFDFQNINATGIFDGVLPMVFDVDGGRIERGTLDVRKGGGNIAYVGDLSQKDLGFWPNLAFQALRSIDYRNLDLTLNGPLGGEMVTEVRFTGISQGKGAKSNFLIRRLQKLPFVFNIRIRAPFRGLLDSAQSLSDPKRLIERNLPALLNRQNTRSSEAAPNDTIVKPPESRIMP